MPENAYHPPADDRLCGLPNPKASRFNLDTLPAPWYLVGYDTLALLRDPVCCRVPHQRLAGGEPALMRYSVLHPDDPDVTETPEYTGMSNHTDCRSLSQAIQVALSKQGEVRIRVEVDEQTAFVYLVVER